MDAFVQDLPDKPAEAVSDGPYGGLVAEPRQEAPKDGLEMCTLASGRSVSCLAEDASHVSVAFGRTAAAILLGAFFFSRAGSYPGGKLRCRRKRTGCGAYLRDHLLCGIDAETGNLRQAKHGFPVSHHRLCKQGVEAGYLFFDESQPLKLQGQHLTVRGMRPSRECFDQTFPWAPQPLVAQLRQALGVCLTFCHRMQDAKAA